MIKRCFIMIRRGAKLQKSLADAVEAYSHRNAEKQLAFLTDVRLCKFIYMKEFTCFIAKSNPFG